MPTEPTKPALIIGSGPSVDRLRPEWLEHFTTFGCNSVYKKFASWGREVDNVVITDSFRLQEIGKAYRDFKGGLYIGDQRYIVPPYRRYRRLLGREFTPLRQLVKESMPVNALTERIPFSKYLSTTVFDKLRVSFSNEHGFNFGRSVSAPSIQLAASLGHRLILLIGIDASYPVEKAYFGEMVSTVNYVNESFVKNPRMMMEPFFVMIQIALEAVGGRLVDCSGGALKFIEKGEIETAVGDLSR